MIRCQEKAGGTKGATGFLLRSCTVEKGML